MTGNLSRYATIRSAAIALLMVMVISCAAPGPSRIAQPPGVVPDAASQVPTVPSGALQVDVEEDLQPDPLIFTVVLTRPASAEDVAALTALVDELGARESRNDADHVSFWSEAMSDRWLSAGGRTVSWWFDAAVASPATIDRLINDTVQRLRAMNLPVVRLLVGDPKRM
jgi:hypothetical protein